MTGDAVRIRRMRFWGRHGATAEERLSPQEIELDVEIAADCSKAAVSDDLSDAVDYDGIYHICERIVTQKSFALLEALAGECLHEIFSDRRIDRATIRARKPGFFDGATPEIELTRFRSSP
jgi:7,8-dihydroneopterin aldolase/epimerase/oxygenase